jgi:hypothetical protein
MACRQQALIRSSVRYMLSILQANLECHESVTKSEGSRQNFLREREKQFLETRYLSSGRKTKDLSINRSFLLSPSHRGLIW